MSAGYRERPSSQIPAQGIEAIWQSQVESPGPYLVLPDGRCDLILHFSTSDQGLGDITPVLTGWSDRAYTIQQRPGTGFVGARFKPGHAPRFLGHSPRAHGRDGLRGGAALALLPALAPLLAPARQAEGLLARLCDFLATRGASAPCPDARTLAIAGAFHASAGQMPIRDIARSNATSPRHLSRHWQWLTGFTPKTYARILQFQRALRLIETEGLSLADAAAEAGYADQAHMSRAFRQIAGFPPGQRQSATLVSLTA